MMSGQDTRRLRERHLILRALRDFLCERGYLEIEPPLLVRSPGLEPHIDAFELGGEHARRYLHTSPEYALKRLVASGLDRIYSLAPCFRDEPPSSTHRPQFTMLEWYRAGADLGSLMSETEELIAAAAAAVGYDLARPFRRLSVGEAFRESCHVDPWAHPDASDFREALLEAGVAITFDVPRGGHATEDWDDLFWQAFLNAVEPTLGRDRGCFVHRWPASQAALARLDPSDPSVALRFELYIGGMELANAFDELTDPVEQRRRFESEQAQRQRLGRPPYPIDEALLRALAAMPPTCGIALGVDRLVMLLTEASHIDEVCTEPW